jgi:hypothetical protein
MTTISEPIVAGHLAPAADEHGMAAQRASATTGGRFSG